MKKTACIAFVILLPALWSCATPPVTMGRMVDPRVLEVAKDGQTAKVGMGAYDGLHGGQQLYVARSNKLVGMLAVRKMDAYTSECIVVASREMSDGKAAETLGDIRAGDVVYRSLMGLTRPGTEKEKVPRMVPVPYEAREKPVNSVTAPPGGAGKTPGVRDVQPPVIPREMVDDWIKTHPNPKTNP